ncbi:MAG: cation-transporting P-type ATPase [Candidatus Bathyarchaeia archaeon]
MAEKTVDYSQMTTENTIKSLQSNPSLGLATGEVATRLRQYGHNEIPEKKPNPLRMFASKFWGLTAWMLEIIMVLSGLLHNYSDLYIVTGLLVFNSILGFEEEQRASSAVESLKLKLQVNARVLRDGSWTNVTARELVPGT